MGFQENTLTASLLAHPGKRSLLFSWAARSIREASSEGPRQVAHCQSWIVFLQWQGRGGTMVPFTHQWLNNNLLGQEAQVQVFSLQGVCELSFMGCKLLSEVDKRTSGPLVLCWLDMDFLSPKCETAEDESSPWAMFCTKKSICCQQRSI